MIETIHLIWLQGEKHLPPKYKEYVRLLRKYNGKDNVKIWDIGEIRNLIRDNHPDLLSIWDSYPFWVQKCDLGRYVIVYEKGGMYTDIDMEPKRSYKDLMERSGGLPTFYLKRVPKEFRWAIKSFLNNNWFYSPKKKHPLFKNLLDYAAASNERTFYDFKMYYILNSTGPQYMMEVVRRYIREDGEKITLFTEDVTDKYFKDDEACSWFKNNFFDKSDKYNLLALTCFIAIVYVIIRHQKSIN